MIAVYGIFGVRRGLCVRAALALVGDSSSQSGAYAQTAPHSKKRLAGLNAIVSEQHTMTPLPEKARVYWLEQTEADVPREDDWLSAAETTVLKEKRFEKRRADWRLGRWTAKRALSSFWNSPSSPSSPSSPVSLSEIEIIAAPTGAPEVYVANAPAAVCISLSHRAGRAMCAVSMSGVALGCDLEIIEPRTDAFVADYFVQEEQELIARAPERFQQVALLWSAKESALKALGEGLRLDTRSVVVTPMNAPMNGALPVNGWSRLEVRCPEGQVFDGWWQRTHDVIRTLVADPPPPPPILLEVAASFPQSSSSD